MSSVSSTSSSLGNTALRGFGGLASGIDRDALIEQMTARTTSKITSKKQAMTKLEWKRDAYRSISNKIIDLQDNYLSYSATKSLKNSDFFAKNQVSVQGDPDYTKYISATGNADTASTKPPRSLTSDITLQPFTLSRNACKVSGSIPWPLSSTSNTTPLLSS